MLQITIPSIELYDDINNEFMSSKEQTLQLEHSLVSLSKWESKFNKPFLTNEDKSYYETIEYIKCMTLKPVSDDRCYNYITPDNLAKINKYIEQPMTATTFPFKEQKKTNREIITAELIYYWMIAMSIPFECQKWHLNRLLTLINVCNIKNQPTTKMSKKEIMERNRAMNEARRRELNTKG